MIGSLTERGSPLTSTSALADRPVVGALVITVLTGVGLQLTHLIDLQERMADVVGWSLRLRLIDFGFRSLIGAIVVLVVLPLLFGHVRRRRWFVAYLRHLRLTVGTTPRLTVLAGAASALVMVGVVVGLAAWVGGMRTDLAAWTEESRWFVVVLALVPGIWEELAFRGLMLRTLQLHWRRWPAILVTAAMFGAMHLTNLVLREPSEVLFEVLMATMLGIAWGHVTVVTGSVLPAMGLHYLIDVLVELLLDPVLDDVASAVIYGGTTLVYPMLTILAVWWLGRRWGHGPEGVRSR